MKLSSEVSKNLEQIKRYSPDFTAMKFNNYDNHVKNSNLAVFDNFNIKSNYNTIQKNDDATHFNLGSSVGQNGRAFLYASSSKKVNQSITNEPSKPSNKVEFRKT